MISGAAERCKKARRYKLIFPGLKPRIFFNARDNSLSVSVAERGYEMYFLNIIVALCPPNPKVLHIPVLIILCCF